MTFQGVGRVLWLAGLLLCAAPSATHAAPAEWPEELGRVRSKSQAGATDADHATYVAALARLEPGSQYDAEAARRELTALSASGASSSAEARYALAWQDEQEGRDERAEGGYVRLIVDAPGGEAGLRARIGLARLLLRRDQPGSAARWLQEAIEADPALSTHALALRELATRAVARDGMQPALRQPTGLREIAGLVAGPHGGAVLADVKAGRVVEFDEAGDALQGWDLEGLEALAGDATGRVFAAAGGVIYRLDPGGRTTRRASTGTFSPVGALAADARGRMWLLDRKGRRIGCLSPAKEEPESCWESDGSRLLDIAWDGRRLLATDVRSRSVVAFMERGDMSRGGLMLVAREVPPLLEVEGFRPSMLAVDGAGRVAALDGRKRIVRFMLADGRPDGERPIAPETAGEVERIALGVDGMLHAFDGRDGAWIRLP